jgi:hypothetical protein
LLAVDFILGLEDVDLLALVANFLLVPIDHVQEVGFARVQQRLLE